MVLNFAVANGIEPDSAKIPIDQIPKLSESFEIDVDYRQLLTQGFLLPDQIVWDSVTFKNGTTETYLRSKIRDSSVAVTDLGYMNRKQQWQFLSSLLAVNNFSMNYYIIAGIYYDRQIFGWFKTYHYDLKGVGRMTAYLHSASESGPYRVYLLSLSMSPVERGKVTYQKGSAMKILRNGNPPVEWNVDTSRVTIYH